MGAKVTVKTDGDMFASLACERVLVELSKDGDSPACPNSWTWEIWFDGCAIDGSVDEMSLGQSVKESIRSIEGIIRELSCMVDYLTAYGAFGEEANG